MKKILLTGFFIVLFFAVSVAQRTIISFDANWKFLREDVQEASRENFN